MPSYSLFSSPGGFFIYADLHTEPQLQVDLGTIRERCSTQFKYRTRQAFLRDLELMANNAAAFNGASNEIAQEAARIVAVAKSALASDAAALDALEVRVASWLNDRKIESERVFTGLPREA